MRRWINPTKRSAWKIAAIISLVSLVAGLLWVLLTDILLYELISDRVLIARIETAKGWGFIGLGAAWLFFLTYRAVRRLASSEATLRAVIDSIADGVLTLARDGTIASSNPAATRMLGAESAGELVGMDAEEFSRRFHVSCPDGSIVAPQDYISQRALAGEVTRSYKVRLFPPGRDEVVAVCTAAPVRPDPDASVELAVSVMHDVTELDRLEQVRDEFFSAAAHALKTPVSVIMAHIHLLSTVASSPALEVIERQCNKISRLTENVLVLARLRSGSLQLHPEPVACAELVEEAAHQMKPAFADRGLTVDVAARPVVFGDRARLALVVRNLVELALRRSTAPTGVGITLDQVDGRARIDVRYRPASELPDEDGPGYIGLNLEQEIVTALVAATNGRLYTERDARGSTDRLELPVMGAPHA
jgi:PAS domain S-box-containing protein